MKAKHRLKARLFSFILALCMLLSAMPMSEFTLAATGDETSLEVSEETKENTETEEPGAPLESDEGEEPKAPLESEEGEEPGAPLESDEGEEPKAPLESEEGEEPEETSESDESEEPGVPLESDGSEEPGAPLESEEGEEPEETSESDESKDPEESSDSNESKDPEESLESDEGKTPEKPSENEETEKDQKLKKPLLLMNNLSGRATPSEYEDVTIIVNEDNKEFDLDDYVKDYITYNAVIKGSGLANTEYKFTLDIPQGMSLPEGELELESGTAGNDSVYQISCGGVSVAEVTVAPVNEFLDIADLTMAADNSSLNFKLNVGADFNIDFISVSLTVHPLNFARSGEAVNGNMTLTVSDESGESDSASTAITAAENKPGVGGWTIYPSKYGKVTQQIYYADNNNDAGNRPNWSETLGDTNSGITPKLYYTLTQVDESEDTITVFEKQELTKDNLSEVGLSGMPKITVNGGLLSVNADSQDGLPVKLEERDQNGTVNNRYTVSWSLEPPEELPSDYTVQNIEDAGSTGGTINNPGWYFVLLGDFDIYVDVQQGEAGSLEEEDILEMLNNFTFYWNYDGMPEDNTDHDKLGEMLEDDNIAASYDPVNKKVTISGIWKYSVNNNPIVYHLMETGDDSGNVDGKLTEDELPGSLYDESAPLDEGDWYNVIYDNSQVPNEGHESSAVYNGGTLRLVRGGNTKYTAKKIWKDIYDQENGNSSRPTATFTLYRYLKSGGVNSASIYTGENNENNVSVVLKCEEGDGSEGGYWKIQAQDNVTEEPVDLPHYDSQSGSEWIYVVKETLTETNAGQYKQVFGTVDWNDKEGKWQETPDDIETEWGADREGNSYLYNNDSLTNLQEGTVSVGAVKEWKSVTFQSGFDDVVVELTLQTRKKGTEGVWENYENTDGEGLKRYLFDFTAVKLTDTLADEPVLQKYIGGDTTTEMEYRWLETAVYKGIKEEDAVDGDKTEYVKKQVESYNQDNPNGITKYEIKYTNGGEGAASTDALIGEFEVKDENGIRTYNVSYDDTTGTSNDTKIINAVESTVDYEVIKEWGEGTTEDQITLQIFRALTGEDFDYGSPYVTFTMDYRENASTKLVITKTENNEIVVSEINDEKNWHALVKGLPAFDENGRSYEYILLEIPEDDNTVARYENVSTQNADYCTKVINSVGGGKGFNLLVRKTWLDDSDVPHREPVTFTLYHDVITGDVTKGEAVKDSKGDEITFTLGGDKAPNIWSSVFWVSPGDENIEAKDVYLVETGVGDEKVNYNNISKHNLYGPWGQNETIPIFNVTTDNHRYQVTYKAEYISSEDPSLPGGVGAAFTITNRRLGNINLKVSKKWVDGRTDSQDSDTTLSDEIGEKIQAIAENGGKRLALAFKLVFDDSMGDTEKKGWEITYSGPDANADTVKVGGEELYIYSNYDDQNNTFSGQTSSEQVIIGIKKGTSTDEYNVYTNNNACFYGLPKYDSAGKAVAYSVKEVWLDITEANSENAPEEITDLSKLIQDDQSKELNNLYQELDELWSAYTEPEFKWTYTNNVGGDHHLLDEQDLEVTNRRGTPKTVTWTKEWEDTYTNESGLRPDLYLDIYRVVHVPVNEGNGNSSSDEGGSPTYERRIEYFKSSGDWKKDGNKWTITLDNVRAFDDYGFAIYYYAVERTQQPADMYDYQPGEYSIGNKSLGNRDVPTIEGNEILSSKTNQTAGDNAYKLLVLGRRADAQDDNDAIDSITWNNDTKQPDGIGSFGTENSYPQYALIENGTFTNTLAQRYSIDGMKYWSNLPSNWSEERLPGVRFLVYRYVKSKVEEWNAEGKTLDDKIKDSSGSYLTNDCDYYAAKLEIQSEQWKKLKSGNGYRYLIEYNGENSLSTETGSLICSSETGDARLERYNEKGELYI